MGLLQLVMLIVAVIAIATALFTLFN